MSGSFFYVDPATEVSVVVLTQVLPQVAVPLRKQLIEALVEMIR